MLFAIFEKIAHVAVIIYAYGLYFLFVWSPAVVGLLFLVTGIKYKKILLIILGSVLLAFGLLHLYMLFYSNWYFNMD